ncbi:MAG TPA: pilin [Patescibacteria group bacterium]|nr:pilin [Patescibacteria group bacterium]
MRKIFVTIFIMFLLVGVLPATAQVQPSGACYPKSTSNKNDETTCKGLGGKEQCGKNGLCYWGECVAVDSKDQQACNTRPACTSDALCKWNRIDGETPGGEGGATSTCGKGRECIPLDPPIGNATGDISDLIGDAIAVMLSIIGSLTVLMLVWGGFQWLTSAGNPEKVQQGTKTMVWAVIGVVLVFASYLILNTFLDYLTGAQ